VRLRLGTTGLNPYFSDIRSLDLVIFALRLWDHCQENTW